MPPHLVNAAPMPVPERMAARDRSRIDRAPMPYDRRLRPAPVQAAIAGIVAIDKLHGFLILTTAMPAPLREALDGKQKRHNQHRDNPRLSRAPEQ
jgi:hypothetical protein